MNIDSLINTFKNELLEDWVSYEGVGTTYHLGDKPNKQKSINYIIFTDKQLIAKKEYYNEYIEKIRLQIDEIEDALKKKKATI